MRSIDSKTARNLVSLERKKNSSILNLEIYNCINEKHHETIPIGDLSPSFLLAGERNARSRGALVAFDEEEERQLCPCNTCTLCEDGERRRKRKGRKAKAEENGGQRKENEAP